VILDGDEVLQGAEDLRETIEAAHTANFDAVLAWCQTIGDGGALGPREHQFRAFDKRRVRYKYAIHTQPAGMRDGRVVVSCDAVFLADYSGDMTGRAERSIPYLLDLAEKSTPGSDDHAHGCAFLARCYSMVNDHANAKRWADALLEHRASDVGYADVWPILVRSTLALDGDVAAELVITRARMRHDDLADLHWWEARINLWRWRSRMSEASPYIGVRQSSPAFLGGLDEASALLGMPMRASA
jgi:hypothetical protein